MPAYQTPSARVFDCLRNAGILLLLVIVLKGFVSMKMETSRQAMVDNKSLRDPFYATALADEPVTHQVLLDDDDDGIVEDTGGVVDTEDDDKAIPFADDDDADEALANADEVDDDDDTVVMIDSPISPSVNRDPISLHLIGERHSGTKWMSEHLHKCFPDIRFNNNLYRWKHWFQDESVEKFPGERFVVVAQFRNAYTWTEGMRSFPHHAPQHFHLDWPDFVTMPWTMPRYGVDLAYNGWTAETSRIEDAERCASVDFLPHQVIPCMADRTTFSTQGISMQALYELRNDGSGKPYDNVLAMRKEKIENFLSVADFDRVNEMYVVKYEEAKSHGTAMLVQALEEALGQKAACVPVAGDPNFRERNIPSGFREFLKTHVDWETEAKIGYFPNDSY